MDLIWININYVSKTCEHAFILCEANNNDAEAKHIYK
jgi:hypothetical protein